MRVGLADGFGCQAGSCRFGSWGDNGPASAFRQVLSTLDNAPPSRRNHVSWSGYSTFADVAVLTDMSGMKTVAVMRNVVMGVLILAGAGLSVGLPDGAPASAQVAAAQDAAAVSETFI